MDGPMHPIRGSRPSGDLTFVWTLPMEKIKSLVRRLKEADVDINVGGGCDLSGLQELEKLIGKKLPNSYARFLKEFSYLGVHDKGFYGIEDRKSLEKNGVWATTLYFQNEHSLPPNYLVFTENTEDYTVTCLALDKLDETGECPIVEFALEPSCDLISKYNCSFEEYLSDYLEGWLEEA